MQPAEHTANEPRLAAWGAVVGRGILRRLSLEFPLALALYLEIDEGIGRTLGHE
jgi:hypothetical protein